jgi:hypothetical protein
MKPGKRLVLLLSALVISGPSTATADDDPEINFDVYVQDSCLTVWLDLAPILNSRAVDRLQEGVDLALECRVSLTVPRRLWGNRQIASRDETLRLSYRKITSEYLIAVGSRLPASPFKAESMPVLFQFLKDSVDLCLSHLSTLEVEKRFSLELRVVAISLTDFNLAEQVGAEGESDSPLRFLFHQFLRITDYGRREFTARSRTFGLSELETID